MTTAITDTALQEQWCQPVHEKERQAHNLKAHLWLCVRLLIVAMRVVGMFHYVYPHFLPV